MGGGGSKTTLRASAVTDITSEAVLSTGQDCTTVAQGDQIMFVGGAGNIFENNQQTMSLGLDVACMQRASQSTDMSAKVQNEVAQKLSESSQALMQWADTSGRSVDTDIRNKVQSSVKVETIQNCLTSLSGKQIMAVQGQGNVFRKNVQDQTLNIVKQCMQGSDTVNRMSADVANTVNQHADYTSKSPLSFITDAITGSIQSVMMLAVIAFIVIVCVAVLYVVIQKRSGKDPFDLRGLRSARAAS